MKFWTSKKFLSEFTLWDFLEKFYSMVYISLTSEWWSHTKVFLFRIRIIYLKSMLSIKGIVIDLNSYMWYVSFIYWMFNPYAMGESIYLLARVAKHVCPKKSINDGGLRWCSDGEKHNKERIKKCVCTLETAKWWPEESASCGGWPLLKPQVGLGALVLRLLECQHDTLKS